MKTIIVATDYSKAATNALHYAASLARETGAKIILFNAFHLPTPASNSILSSNGITRLVDENRAHLREIASEINEEYGVLVETISTISYVVEEVNHLADKNQADLIVMGIQENASEYGFLGSVTTYMISNTKFPVLVVPEGTPFTGIKEIAFACDYPGLPSDHKLPLLKDLSTSINANIQVLHVEKTKEPTALSKQGENNCGPDLENILSGVRHSYRDLTDEHILDGIEKGVRESNADLLVMIPKHTGFWNMIFNRSRTRKMAHKTNVPLLALPLVEKQKEYTHAMKIYHEKGENGKPFIIRR